MANMPWLSSTTPRPAQVLQRNGCGAGLGSRAGAGVADGVADEVERGGQPGDGVGEVEVQLGFEVADRCGPVPVGRPRPPRPATASEQVAEHVADAAAAHVEGEAAGTTEATRATGPAEAPPIGPRARTSSYSLRFSASSPTTSYADEISLKRSSAVAIVGVGVGVDLPRQLPVRAGDVLGVGLLVDAKDLVVVLLEPLPRRVHVTGLSP